MKMDVFMLEKKKMVLSLIKKNKDVILSCILFGLISHGFGLVNFYAIHDQAHSFFDGGNVGSTFASGRWGLGVLSIFIDRLFGNHHYSFPLLNSVLSLFFITITVVLLVALFKIVSPLYRVILSAIMVSTPVVTGTFGYMFTAPYYMFSLMLSVFGAYFISRYSKKSFIILGILLLSFATGIYQAYIPVAITIFFLFFLFSVLINDSSDIKKQIRLLVKLLVSFISFLVIYLLINSLIIFLGHIKLTDYQGISSMTDLSFGIIINRLINAYKLFFFPPIYNPKNVFPINSRFAYYLFLIINGIIFCYLLYLQIKNRRITSFVLSLFIICLLPLCYNFIYIMTDSDLVHNLMLYSNVLIVLFPLAFLSKFTDISSKTFFTRIVSTTMAFVAMYCVCTFVFYDNSFYMKADLLQRRLTSYYTSLVTQIKSTEGYKESMPVVFIDFENFKDSSVQDIEKMDINIFPYYGQDTQSIINNYAWKEQIQLFTGFSPEYVDSSFYTQNNQVLSMPSYPDYGSIKVINEHVVVKF